MQRHLIVTDDWRGTEEHFRRKQYMQNSRNSWHVKIALPTDVSVTDVSGEDYGSMCVPVEELEIYLLTTSQLLNTRNWAGMQFDCVISHRIDYMRLLNYPDHVRTELRVVLSEISRGDDRRLIGDFII